jgi:hypothetical protein
VGSPCLIAYTRSQVYPRWDNHLHTAHEIIFHWHTPRWPWTTRVRLLSSSSGLPTTKWLTTKWLNVLQGVGPPSTCAADHHMHGSSQKACMYMKSCSEGDGGHDTLLNHRPHNRYIPCIGQQALHPRITMYYVRAKMGNVHVLLFLTTTWMRWTKASTMSKT